MAINPLEAIALSDIGMGGLESLDDRLQTFPTVSQRGTVGCQLLKLRSAALTNFKLEVWFDFKRPAATGGVSRCQ